MTTDTMEKPQSLKRSHALREKNAPFARTQKLRNWIRNSRPELCTERAVLFTESWKATESEPTIVRKALAMAHVLENMTVYINPDEIIVGNYTEIPKSAPVTPESVSTWMEKEIDTFTDRIVDQFHVSEETRAILMNDVFPYWRERTVEARAEKTLPRDTLAAWKAAHTVINCSTFARNYPGHVVADIQLILEKGYLQLRKEAEAHLAALDMTLPESIERAQFYRAEIIIAQAAANFGERFALEAGELAAKEKDPTRREELLGIVEACRQVPALPARNFREAIQVVWFVQLMLQLEGDGTGVSTERFDSMLNPYYVADREAGRIDYRGAQELIECLWCKMYEIMKCYDIGGASFFAGYNVGQTLTIGGQDEYGRDDTNDVSFIVLDAEDNIRLTQPNLMVRVNRNTPDDFLLRACEHIKLGTGKPPLFNDDCIIPGMLNRGVSMKDARGYSLIGCVEPSPKGKAYNWTNAGFFNLAKCLELALTNGICRLTGERMGLSTGNPSSFAGIEDVVKAYQAQVAHFVRHIVVANNHFDMAHRELLPLPLLSLSMHGCMEKGVDVTAGGTIYNNISVQGVGIADVADSLRAIERLVFTERKYTLSEINAALDGDFKGFEALRRELSAVEKYGNDDDRVDSYAVMISRHYCDEVEKYRNPRGGKYQPGLFSVSSNVPLGIDVGALPSGRLSGTPLADGLSPAPGADKSGPTSVVKSVGKIDHSQASNGTLLNQKFSVQTLDSRDKMRKFMQYIRTYMAMGGHQIQINIIDGATLRRAKEKPEEYGNLMVRVAGYSAFFTELHPALQDALIERTEHQSV